MKGFEILLLAVALCSFMPYHKETVSNPVITDCYHDASLIKGDDGWFYSFASSVVPRERHGDINYYTVSIYKSHDLVNWSFFKYALNDSLIIQQPVGDYDRKRGYHGRFIWSGSDGRKKYYPIWAPDIIKYDGKYLLFVSLHLSKTDSKIAVFESTRLSEDFHYKGIAVSNDKFDGLSFFDIYEIIDPCPIEDKGRLYLVFGSFRRWTNGKIIKGRERMGVYIVPLDVSKGVSMAGKPKFLTDCYEGVQILKHKGKYYLLGTNGSLSNSTYQISYAKSNNLFGPYLNNKGLSISDTVNIHFGNPILKTNDSDRFNGFGCPSVPVTDKHGRQWMLVHGHAPELSPLVASKACEERYDFLIELHWDKDDNPYFKKESILSNTQPMPNL